MTKYKPNFIEISEDAYKQNWVYRPWSEEKVGKKADNRRREGALENSVKILRAAHH